MSALWRDRFLLQKGDPSAVPECRPDLTATTKVIRPESVASIDLKRELEALVVDSRFCALDVAGKHILLLFTRGGSVEPNELPGGTIPPHDGAGQLHAAFAVDVAELPVWESHLVSRGIEILSRVSWPRGGQSIYFRDPDGHLLELLTPGVWKIY